MPSEKLYTCLFEEQTEEEAFVQVYWARAPHIGAAIEKMASAARLNGLARPEPRQLDPYDIENLQGDIEPSQDAEIFWATSRIYFDPEPIFLLPYGIIASCIEGEHDVEEIAAGFTRCRAEDGKTTIEVNVERAELFPLYESLLRLCDSYRVFWYLLHDHWDSDADQFLVNESLDAPEKILAHLGDHELDALMNGYVTLTAYHEEGATNLNISDHKRIVIMTYSESIADDYAATLSALGYPEMDELVSIDDRIHHWHYRHPESRSRSELTEHLRSLGFRDWVPGE